MKCNACGSSNLIDGTVTDSDGGQISVFIPSDRPYYKKIFGAGGNKVTSYACLHCNNLQFFVEFSEQDKARHVQFEGKQPSVMERIADDESDCE